MTTTAIIGNTSIARSIGFSIRRTFFGLGRALTTSSKARMDQAAAKVLTSPFPESEYIKQKRAEAIQKLGTNWVLHLNYKPISRHSNDRAIWWPNRTLKYVM
jgi:aspartate/tyrosine/aromatic aminotransferase